MENIIIADNTEVKVFENSRELYNNAAGYMCASMRHFVNRHNRCTIALSGGNSPKKLYDEIGSRYKNSADWAKAFFFWGDERCVPPDSDESNYKMANEHLLSKLPVPEENIFRIRGEIPPEEAAALYDADVRNYFNNASLPSFDIILLGIGTDGHTASLFPGSRALEIKDKLAVAVYTEKIKSYRVTLTIPVINYSKNILMIAEGEEKSEIIKRVFNDKRGELPVQKVNASNGKLTWFIDKAAAGTAFPRK